jgi:hypothetical protein
MTASSIADTAKASGIGLFVVDGKLRVEAPRGMLTPELRGEIASHKAEIIHLLMARTTRLAPPMSADVARTMAVDSERMFRRLWRRTANRLSRVYGAGCLTWVETHAPELWARREAARQAWDDPAVYADFTACRISWAAYRRLIYTWAKVEVECIRRHRDRRNNEPTLRIDA